MDRPQEALVIVFALYLPAMVLIDRAQWKVRLDEILGTAKCPALFRSLPSGDPIAVLLWFPFFALDWMEAVRPRSAPAHASWQLWQIAGDAIGAVVLFWWPSP